MDIETAREYCLSKKAVTECFPFDEYSLVMKVMNKMFALIDLESANKICLKCDPEYALELREHYVAIEGAYHFNKKYWNQVFLDGDVDDKLLKQLIDHSVEEVLKKFTKKMRTEYEECQTAGKGQRGNTWEAEEGKNLLFSFVLYPSFLEARRQFILSQIVSLAIKEELSRWSDEITIKWPNDIYWKDKKICGILIENDLSGHHIRRSIAGIGININQEVFNSDAPNPVSLNQITGKEHDRYEILAHILRRVQIYYNSLQMEDFAVYSDEISTRYARSLFRRRGLHPYEDANGKFLARLLRVEQDGRFVLEDEGGSEREYLFKEVQYIL